MTANQVKIDLKKSFADALSKMKDTGLQETAFNEAIGGNFKFMEVGEHKCTLLGAEPVEGVFGPQLKATWSNDNGATITQYVPFFRENPETKEVSYSRAFLSLLNVSISDIPTKLEYGNKLIKQAAENKTTLIDALTGIKAIVVVKKGKKGFEISEDSSGQFFVKNVEDGTVLIDTPFQSASDAATMAKDEGYSRAFNRVHYIKPDKDAVAASSEALKALLATV